MKVSTVTGNTSKAIERHLSSSYKTVLYVAKNMDKVDSVATVMNYFDTYYIGAFTSPPTTGAMGGALVKGMFYLNTIDDTIYFWVDTSEGLGWVTIDGIKTNALAEIEEYADIRIAELSATADEYDTTFQEYLLQGENYLSQTNILHQQTLALHAAVTGMYEEFVTLLPYLNDIRTLVPNIEDIQVVAGNISAVVNVFDNMDKVIEATEYVDTIEQAVIDAQASAVSATNSANASANSASAASDSTTQAKASELITNINAALTAADVVSTGQDLAAMEIIQTDLHTVQDSVVSLADQTSENMAATAEYMLDAATSKDLARTWAVGTSGSESGTPSDTNNAYYYSELARTNANQTFKSGGFFEPTASQEYPDVTDIAADTIWLIKFPVSTNMYTFTSGILAGITVRNGYQLVYDTPVNAFDYIPTTIAGAVSVNNVAPDATGNVSLTGDNIENVFTNEEAALLSDSFDAVLLTKSDIGHDHASITGSAASLAVARLINGTAFDGTADISTANWGASRTITIGKTSKVINGSADVSFSLDEIDVESALDTRDSTGKNLLTRLNAASNAIGVQVYDYATGETRVGGCGVYGLSGGGSSDTYGYVGGGDASPWNQLRVGVNTFTYKGSNVLTASNYTSYAPSKTGDGASGTWGITAAAVTVNSSASTTYYDILWASGNNQYRASNSKLQVQPSSGNIRTAGHVTFQYTSDINIKRNLQEFDNPLGKVCQLRTGTYEKLQVIEGREADEVGNYPTEYRPESGFIAQDLERVLDNVIYENDEGLKVIRGGGFEIEALLAGAIKQLKREHDEEINQLRQQVQSLMEAQ